MQVSIPGMKKIKKIPLNTSVVVLFLVFVTSACSLRIMYNRLDWIIPIYIDEYVSLTDQQETFFDRAISNFLTWHRAEELPRYIQFLALLREAQRQPMSRKQVLIFFDQAEDLWTELLQQALPSLLELAAEFDDAQLQELNDALNKKIRKLQKKYGSKNQTARRAVSANKMADVMQDLLGKLTTDQAEMIQLWSTTKNDTTGDWLIFRENWRRRLIELLEHREDAGYQEELRLFLLKPETLYGNAHRQAVRENRQLLAQLLAELSATLTPIQRVHLQQKIGEFIDDLQALHTL